MAPKGSDFAVFKRVGIPSAVLKNRNKDKRLDKRSATGYRRIEQTEESDAPSETKYRDRALERSQLKDEYLKVEEEYQLLKKQTEEESRYMGGDEEHTHMVKGLDYTLLNKVKSNLEKTDVHASKETQDEDPGMGHTDLGFYIYKNFFYHTNLHNRHFKEKIDNTVELLKRGHKFKKNRNHGYFYVYNLKLEPEENDVPTMTISSESDTNVPKVLNTYRDNRVKTELMEAFTWHAENRKKKREDRLPFRPAKDEPMANVDDGDDIFENAGEYKSDEYNLDAIEKLKENERYFETQEVVDETVDYSLPINLLLKRKATNKKKDGYDECYPDFDDMDSDDDVATKKKKKGNKEWKEVQKVMEGKTMSIGELEGISQQKRGYAKVIPQ
ncbi:conserved hypothetical protein [Theileria equi strain WA]|uniref:RED-like N-terminal domain-containing protein n=1 Tax=Theileria equi strain WA TaxID=1537102 RepID=L1L927_THEEQ|nr:conserved hypothetical protein [Theileria equi strain WA]EKX72011.1 conserved hypothetical protein [Theileria equi strain WA]|eukprot:XP_004831463.1 conserved hypothetical protein [Theileria equi strain WA]